ncbi:MAG TPA: ARMT1-like domain-containing protein, partial [Anaerolineae bacterium]|nr:ARMT1-like domain-containing protein [Anaerolineae bacterium]
MTKLPIPEPLRGTDPNSFAQYTVTVRLPNIIHHVLIENDFSEPIFQQLKTLMEEIPSTPIRYLNDTEAPDTSQWAEYIEPYLGLNWLQIPWFLAETYLYRRILEATGYFKPAEGYHVDPFAYQKQRGLDTTQDAIANLSLQLNTGVNQPDKSFDFFTSILMISLWGNQADLSLWPAGNHEQPKYADLHISHSDILINDTSAIIDYLANQRGKSLRFDFIADNAGYELVCDLALADFCLSGNLASTVVL